MIFLFGWLAGYFEEGKHPGKVILPRLAYDAPPSPWALTSASVLLPEAESFLWSWYKMTNVTKPMLLNSRSLQKKAAAP